jgi:acyl-CoA synthetase (AMP-forming)/AMP-acid ligase II
MSGGPSRLRNVLGHLLPINRQQPDHHVHQLSPTFFLERAAAIEPGAEAVYHVTRNGKVLRRSYMELADRARGLAYFLRKKGYKRVGLLAPNTPAFLESVYGIVAAGGVIVPVNIRLKPEDVAYIFDFAEVDSIIVDVEYEGLLDAYRKDHPKVPLIVDVVSLHSIPKT